MQRMEIQKNKRRFTGEVVSRGADKTAHVQVSRIKVHPKYGKRYTRHEKFPAHDPENRTKVGDKVIIEECRPISKTKRWAIVEIV